MLLMAATTFSQTSRRPANTREPAGQEEKRNSSSIERTDKYTASKPVIKQENQEKSSNHQRHNSPSNNMNRRNNGLPHDGVINKDKQYTHTHTDYYSPRKSVESRHKSYHYKSRLHSIEYRRVHYPYRKPERITVVWTPEMHLEYRRIYPMVKYWHYPIGYRIPTVSAYDASYYRGEIINVYGKVHEVFYDAYADEFILYFGAYYPYHDFTVVMLGSIARSFSNHPERFFNSAHVLVTGLVTLYDGKPEIYLSRTYQIRFY